MSEEKLRLKQRVEDFLNNTVLDVIEPLKTVGGWILVIACMFAGEFDYHHEAWQWMTKTAVEIGERIG